MKKSVLTLLILLVCSFQRAVAYEYFVIYFSDGTKSEAFYASDVKSIGYSKTDLNGIERDSWQVQEIQTIDSLYRYSLASIRYVDFKEGDMNKVIEDIADAITAITPIYASCETIDDIAQHLSEIKSAEGVEDAWISNQTLYVKIKDWETITYDFFPEVEPFDGIFAQEAKSQVRERAKAPNSRHQDYTEDIKNVCVINQVYRNDNFASVKNAENSFINLCEDWHFNVKQVDEPSPMFFLKDIYDYDYVFLITHGGYDVNGQHWLFTGEQLYVANESGVVDKNVIKAKVQEIFDEKVKENEKEYPISRENKNFANYLTFGSVKEKRGGSEVSVYYTKISNKWIAAAPYQFKQKGKAIIFNTACKSLMGDEKTKNNLAQAFFEKGAGQYIGYDESNNRGHIAGNGFFSGLLNGKSSFVSYLSIPKRYRDYTFDDKNRKNIHTVLRRIANPDYKYDICITRPTTLEAENISNGGSSKYVLNGEMDAYRPLCDFYVNNSYNDEVLKNTYGFLYSENPNMTDATKITVDIESDNLTISKNNCFVEWKAEIDEQDLQPNITYYYCAYMNDGLYDCYGDVKQFTIAEQAEPYFVYDYATKTTTFYYDGKCESRKGVTMYYNYAPRNVEKIVFDSSFANYNVNEKECTYWFGRCKQLTTIENIQYLNTSQMTDMSGMFNSCSSLTNLDLSCFDTSNVTDMNNMFYECSSLTSLNLSGFNTSNVTDMHFMFYNCSSLTNLNLSGFNTANVTNMNSMFWKCKSLTKLYLSSFNTAKVTTMHSMFEDCSSLTNLVLSSDFNTANVTDMSLMFDNCSSLTELDLSSFNTDNVTDMFEMFQNCRSLKTIYAGNWPANGTGVWVIYYDYMFGGCDNLVGGKGTRPGYNAYGDGEGYSCSCDRDAAHIDGGKDWPGLFTAK